MEQESTAALSQDVTQANHANTPTVGQNTKGYVQTL